VGPHGRRSFLLRRSRYRPPPGPSPKRGREFNSPACRGVPLARRPFAHVTCEKKSQAKPISRRSAFDNARRLKRPPNTARAALMCAAGDDVCAAQLMGGVLGSSTTTVRVHDGSVARAVGRAIYALVDCRTRLVSHRCNRR